MKARYLVAAGVAAFAMSASAHAAQSDYFLKIEGIDGEAKVAEWSFGACNAGQCSTVKSPRDAASGQATGKRQHKPSVTASQNTQSLRESPTKASTGKTEGIAVGEEGVTDNIATGAIAGTSSERTGYDLKVNKGARTAGSGRGGGKASMSDLSVMRTTGDLDGDGMADLAYAATQAEVTNFSLTFQKIEATWRKVCGGKHIASATLRTGSDSYEITGATVSCTTGGVMGVDDWQQQMRLTGGQMKHTKTGHVTLLK